jgi:lysophospholipid acyltransferase (LPLAT)-like uncharacterized protein
MTWRSLLGALLGLVARAWLASLRLTLIIDAELLAATRRPRSLVFWHGQQFALLRWARTQHMAALVSRSSDGELVAAALARLGVASARGSSSRGGAAALKSLVRMLRAGVDVAFAADGPRGPARVVRAARRDVGASRAARLARGVVVPMAAACSRCLTSRRSWDAFELPLPFTRVAVVLGGPIEPCDGTPEAVGAAIDGARLRAERALTDGGARWRGPVSRATM